MAADAHGNGAAKGDDVRVPAMMPRSERKAGLVSRQAT